MRKLQRQSPIHEKKKKKLASCLFLNQIAPQHLNKILAMNMERVIPENPNLKNNYYVYIYNLHITDSITNSIKI